MLAITTPPATQSAVTNAQYVMAVAAPSLAISSRYFDISGDYGTSQKVPRPIVRNISHGLAHRARESEGGLTSRIGHRTLYTEYKGSAPSESRRATRPYDRFTGQSRSTVRQNLRQEFHHSLEEDTEFSAAPYEFGWVHLEQFRDFRKSYPDPADAAKHLDEINPSLKVLSLSPEDAIYGLRPRKEWDSAESAEQKRQILSMYDLHFLSQSVTPKTPAAGLSIPPRFLDTLGNGFTVSDDQADTWQ